MTMNKENWLSKSPPSNHQSVSSLKAREIVESSFKIPGIVREVGELEEKDSGFIKQDLVLLTHDYKPQLVRFEFLCEKTSLLGGVAKGERVEVTFRIEGKEWKGKTLNNLIATSLEKISEKALVVGGNKQE